MKQAKKKTTRPPDKWTPLLSDILYHYNIIDSLCLLVPMIPVNYDDRAAIYVNKHTTGTIMMVYLMASSRVRYIQKYTMKPSAADNVATNIREKKCTCIFFPINVLANRTNKNNTLPATAMRKNVEITIFVVSGTG